MSVHPGASFAWLMECTCGVWEAQPQALCISGVRNFVLYLTEGYYKPFLHRRTYLIQCAWRAQAHSDMVPFRVLCAVRTQLWSCGWFCYTLLFVQLFFSRACKHDMGALPCVKCGNTRKSAHPPYWQTFNVLCPWALFRETMVIACPPLTFGMSHERCQPFVYCSWSQSRVQSNQGELVIASIHGQNQYIHNSV